MRKNSRQIEAGRLCAGSEASKKVEESGRDEGSPKEAAKLYLRLSSLSLASSQTAHADVFERQPVSELARLGLCAAVPLTYIAVAASLAV